MEKYELIAKNCELAGKRGVGAERKFLTELVKRLGGTFMIYDFRMEIHGYSPRMLGCQGVSFVYAPDGNVHDGVYIEVNFDECRATVNSERVKPMTPDAVADVAFAEAYGRKTA